MARFFHSGQFEVKTRSRWDMFRRINSSGFTIIELMIVVVIIGILAAIGVPNYFRFAARAREAGVSENMHTVQLAMEAFSVDHLGVYPVQADEPEFKLLLPGTNYPDNPFNNLETAVSWNSDPGNPGEMGIFNLPGGGYTIKGQGADKPLDPVVTGD